MNMETSDPYGFFFSPISMRVRGQQAIGMSTMIEGIPIWGIQRPGPRLDIFDLENVQSITLYRGGSPPDKGLGGMDTAGALDVGLVKPADTFGGIAKQSAGSYDFLRTFVRVDSGKLASGTKFFSPGLPARPTNGRGRETAPSTAATSTLA